MPAGLALAWPAGAATAAGPAMAGHAGHDLGKVDFPISCSPAAQTEFTRGVALLHHMTYPQAREAFTRAAQIDPQCAMAHWGIAMTLFQPLWPTRPSLDERRRGWEEAQKANALKPPTERERLFVDAVAAFFQEPEAAHYWARIRRWEKAMEKVYRAFPHDAEAATFYALAHLAVAPADKIARANSDEAAEILLAVYKQNPAHPGAMHYLVHANDVPGRERESLEIIRKYEELAPNNPHALHMPTHIYTRLGEWDAVISGNTRAAAAALQFPAGDHRQYVWDEYPHALEYLIYAALQKGDDAQAAAALKRLEGTARLQPSFKTAFHLASTQARYALERRAWSEAAGLRPREPATLDWDHFPWPESVTWFARGLGAAHEGKMDDARRAEERLAALETVAQKAGEELFARNIRVLHLAVSAWRAFGEKETETSLAQMRAAADLENATPKAPVTPGPTLPANELLGDLLLEQKRPAEAVAAYQRSLGSYPRRFNSLLGLARAARAAGDEKLARASYEQLRAVADRSTPRAGLREAEDYLGGRL